MVLLLYFIFPNDDSNESCYMLAQHTFMYDIRFAGDYRIYRWYFSSHYYCSPYPMGTIISKGE